MRIRTSRDLSARRCWLGTEMGSYDEPNAGDWVIPTLESSYRMSCCDCGLVHNIDFKIVKANEEVNGFKPSDFDRPAFRVFRNNRSTGQMRRYMVPIQKITNDI